MKNSKHVFLESQYWMMSIQAAFQRASIYNSDASETSKKAFRDYLHTVLIDISSNYEGLVTEDEHIKNIETILNSSVDSEVLSEGRLNFGVCQKILNLYLKYLWCAGWIQTPPHFPVDRLIQEKLGFKESEIVSWTNGIHSRFKYMAIIDRAKRILVKTNIQSLAELELEIYTHSNLKKILTK
ncbi:hypothetical protein EGI26_12500 [Lacihabitans sp. CCS-44]|uniref:hypothetical protein n=1 Tax=Lacihabitans sp. CCS-44 TaxID=2487331 RepID=UPI0020CF45F5|nr:hypothetical protein [Lacihabitans sp. CCS-44]MCP9755974.1 hypothetical protein [Lacihabitans sp. CCS-44]